MILIVKLLNKLQFRARPERWQLTLGRFLCTSLQETSDMFSVGVTLSLPEGNEAFSSFFDLPIQMRTKIFLFLLESQFVRNLHFREKLKPISAADLRPQPIGQDLWGGLYWLFVDSAFNILLYRATYHIENCTAVADSFETLQLLIDRLVAASSAIVDTSTALEESVFILSRGPSFETAPKLPNGFLPQDLAPAMSIAPSTHSFAPSRGHTFTISELASSPTSVDRPSSVKREFLIDSELSIKTEDRPPPHSPTTTTTTTTTANSLAFSAHNILLPTGGKLFDKISTPPLTPTNHCVHIKPESPQSVASEIRNEEDSRTPEVLAKPSPRSEPSNVVSAEMQPSPKEEPGVATACVEEEETGNQPVLRRSCRLRKQVQFLAIEPSKPKKAPKANTLEVDNARPEGMKEKVAKKATPRPKKVGKQKAAVREKRKQKSNQQQQQQQQLKFAEEAERESAMACVRKRNKRKSKKRKPKSSRPWEQVSSPSEDTDYEDYTLAEKLESAAGVESDSEDGEGAAGSEDWLDKVESEFDWDLSDSAGGEATTKQGRNLARHRWMQKKPSDYQEEASEESACQICTKSDLPECLLLCDQCDLGHHTMCLQPPIFIIPEGDWFCPRCSHSRLIQALRDRLTDLQAKQRKAGQEARMQERLKFVNISVTNILGNGREPSRSADRYSEQFFCDSEAFSSDSSARQESFSDESARWRVSRGNKRPPPLSVSRREKASKRRRISDSDSGSSRSASSRGLKVPALRSSRQNAVRYDVNEAFKTLDDLLSVDEKYASQRELRKARKLASGQEKGNFAVGKSEEGPETRVPPRAGRPRARRKLATTRLWESSEESASLDGGGGGGGDAGGGSANDEFLPAESDYASDESLYSKSASSSSEASSAASWRGRHPRSRSHKSAQHRRLIARFDEGSDDEIVIRRPRRATTARLNYLESDSDTACKDRAPASEQVLSGHSDASGSEVSVPVIGQQFSPSPHHRHGTLASFHPSSDGLSLSRSPQPSETATADVEASLVTPFGGDEELKGCDSSRDAFNRYSIQNA